MLAPPPRTLCPRCHGHGYAPRAVLGRGIFEGQRLPRPAPKVRPCGRCMGLGSIPKGAPRQGAPL